MFYNRFCAKINKVNRHCVAVETLLVTHPGVNKNLSRH